jgi:hypothetical protein
MFKSAKWEIRDEKAFFDMLDKLAFGFDTCSNKSHFRGESMIKSMIDSAVQKRVKEELKNIKIRIPQEQINDAVVKFFTENKWFITKDGKKLDTFDLIRKFAMNTIGVAENGELNPEFLKIVQEEVAKIIAEQGVCSCSGGCHCHDENPEIPVNPIVERVSPFVEKVEEKKPTKCEFPDCKNYRNGEVDMLCEHCDNYIVKQKKDSECAKNLKDSKANTKSKDTPVEENPLDGSKDTPIEPTPFGGSELETALYKLFKRYGII